MSADELANHLIESFACVHATVEDESYFHQGHKHADERKHFKVTLVSEKFSNMSLVQKHRSVFDVLKDEMKSNIHALSIQAFSLQEWEEKKSQ